MPPDCTPKQAAWVEKIIAEKKANALRAGLSEQEWMKIEVGVSKHGLRTWIDLRDETTRTLKRVPLLADLPPVQAKSDKQAAYGEKMRFLALIREIDVFLPVQMIDPLEREAAIRALIHEVGKETSAKKWIEEPLIGIATPERRATALAEFTKIKETELAPQLKIADQIERLIRVSSPDDAEATMKRLEPAMEREEYEYVSRELEEEIKKQEA